MDPVRECEASGQTDELSVNRFNIHSESSHSEKSTSGALTDRYPSRRLTRSELPGD